MAGTPLEIIRRAYDAWNRDDFEAGISLAHPDLEWHTSGVFPGFEPVYHGHAGLRAYWDAMKAEWAYFRVDLERVLEAADTVVIEVRFEAVGKHSGAKVELPFTHAWQVEGGLVKRFAAYESFEAALEAEGLAPPATRNG